MSVSPYPAPTACVEPRLGAETTQALGRSPPARVDVHLAVCPACQLQRAAMDGLDATAVSAPVDLRSNVRRLVPGRFP